MRFAHLLATLALGLVLGCPQSTPPVAPTEPVLPPVISDDDKLLDAATRACAGLARVGCPEGYGSVGGQPCVAIVLRAYSARPLPLECWAAADTAVQAKGCGSLRCIR